jgi:hypothetical protein
MGVDQAEVTFRLEAEKQKGYLKFIKAERG